MAAAARRETVATILSAWRDEDWFRPGTAGVRCWTAPPWRTSVIGARPRTARLPDLLPGGGVRKPVSREAGFRCSESALGEVVHDLGVLFPRNGLAAAQRFQNLAQGEDGVQFVAVAAQ